LVLRFPTHFLALFWGVSFAIFLQFTPAGRFLVRRRTWLAVVIGVGVDLVLMVTLLPLETWLMVVGVVGASSVGVILRSLFNEWMDEREALTASRPEDLGR
jgi:hypothetical protein